MESKKARRAKKTKSNNGTKMFIIILILFIIVAGVILGYKIIKDKENKEEIATSRRKYNTRRE